MIIVPVKQGDSIEKALKVFKRKFDRTGTMRELRNRKEFKKTSQVKRRKMEKARYVQSLRQAEMD
ncbi:MAG: 30S ribosomal protein S21 [Porphyromonas sp.]|nr:30S ribosomal protein S21 [Bacteroidales bacterium]MDD7559381.1 30S ribosomal protein S21 [Bacteroidales bacterium]MDY3101226.1 30S ribosomal protein S21 [Porphyromonas sp.]